MPSIARPFQVYDFTAFAKRQPTSPPPGDRLDAQLQNHADAIVAAQLAIEKLTAAVEAFAQPKQPTLATPVLYVGAGGPYATDDAGATATSADYAQVSIAWAENLPWTIPGNILAINAISGDHWSSRWWANRAALLLQSVIAGGSAPSSTPIAELVAVTGPNALALLQNAPVDATTTMEVVVNGRAFCGCAVPAPFTVSGNQITWASSVYGVNPGDQVIARYRFSATASVAPPAVAGAPAISLYYVAVQGQKDFLLSTPDRFGLSYVLRPTSKVEVCRNGARLMPDDGSGKGGYVVSTNSVSLLWPAGADETIAIDVWEQTGGSGGGGIPEAPTDGQTYGRNNAAWTAVASSGGGLADAPNDGTAYARKSAAWAHFTHLDITDWTASLAPYALTTSVPAASSTPPVMDGAAAVGTGTTWARADHVHQSDTSRLATSGGVLTGGLQVQGPADLKVQTVTQSGANLSINRTLGENCALSLTASITAVTVTNWPASGTTGKVRLIIANTGAFAISGWPAGTIWPGGTAPTITSGAGKKDIVLLMSDDGGTTIYGSVVGQDYR